jgi:two-component system nitrogen regulation sensor histidine kinase NtrY
MALVPTVLVAVFAVLSVNLGLEGWFSDRVRQVVGSSLSAAQAYEGEQREDLTADAGALAAYLNLPSSRPLPARRPAAPAAEPGPGTDPARAEGGLSDRRHRRAEDARRPLLSVRIRTRPPRICDRAREGEAVLIEDWANNEFRALVHLDAFADRYLYVSRDVDGSILSLLDKTQETVKLYNQLEANAGGSC